MIQPVIISASRSTDIPAFYSEWFFNRLKEGFFVWTNPYNQTDCEVSIEKTRLFVFWSKNPKPIINYLDKLNNYNYYFQYTLNNYDLSIEPNLPSIDERIETFKTLSDKIGKEKVVWRFDPLLLSNEITIDNLIEKIKYVGEKIKNYTNRLVISFIDISQYKKVKENLSYTSIREFTSDEINEFCSKLQILNKELNLDIFTCGEKENLIKYSIKKGSCIDKDLIISLFKEDKELMNFVNNIDKDKGQRTLCNCIQSKDIGKYSTCPHFCKYCYANKNDNVVKNNYKNHNPNNIQI